MSAKCLHCDEDERPASGGRYVVVTTLADYPMGSRYWDSEYTWLHSRAFCDKHAEGADEDGYVKWQPRGKHSRDWRPRG